MRKEGNENVVWGQKREKTTGERMEVGLDFCLIFVF